MTEAVLDIKQWGNNLGIRLPAAIAKAAHLHADQRVRITVEAGRVMIMPLVDTPLTLEQRLTRYTPQFSLTFNKITMNEISVRASMGLTKRSKNRSIHIQEGSRIRYSQERWIKHISATAS